MSGLPPIIPDLPPKKSALASQTAKVLRTIASYERRDVRNVIAKIRGW
jgi:hypothetical protein